MIKLKYHNRILLFAITFAFIGFKNTNAQGLSGYISSYSNSTPGTYGYGFGFYSLTPSAESPPTLKADAQSVRQAG